MPRLDSRWLRHLEPDDKPKFEQALLNDTLVLGRLYAILEEMDKEMERSELSETDFDSPNWAHKVAFRNGQKSQIKRVMTLLNFIKE